MASYPTGCLYDMKLLSPFLAGPVTYVDFHHPSHEDTWSTACSEASRFGDASTVDTNTQMHPREYI
jgi:hypothetical protein